MLGTRRTCRTRMFIVVAAVAAVAVAIGAPSAAQAQYFSACTGGPFDATTLTTDKGTVSRVNRGWYRRSSGNAGEHAAGNDNYSVGSGGLGDWYRNFFVFDVSSLAGSHTASIRFSSGCMSGSGTVLFRGLSNASAIPSWTLADDHDAAVFDLLGMGAVHATFAFTTGVTPYFAPVTLTLDASGVVALNAAAARGGRWGVGGALASDPSSVVPEPATLVLVGAGLLGVLGALALRLRL